MKKNVNILFLFFCIFFSIVCCSKNNSIQTIRDQPQKQNTEFNISTLYGTWLIDKVIPLNVISTDPNEYLGKTISIDKDLFVVDGIEFQINKIENEIWDENQLIMETKSSVSDGILFKDLGIKNTTINNTTVEVIDNNKKKRFSIISSSKIQIFIVGNNYYIMKSI